MPHTRVSLIILYVVLFVCYFALVCLEFELFKCNSLLPFRYCTAFLSFTKSNNFRSHLHFPSLGYVISFQTSYSVQFSWLTFTSSYKQAWQFISRCCFDWLIQADNTFTKFVESFFLYYVFFRRAVPLVLKYLWKLSTNQLFVVQFIPFTICVKCETL